MKTAISTNNSPPPAGTYHQGIIAKGEFVFISGQTPRTLDGKRLGDVPFTEQATCALENLKGIADAANCDLKAHAVKVTVYLKNLNDRAEFDEIYANYVGDTPPSRTIVQSNFIDFDIEIDAILVF